MPSAFIAKVKGDHRYYHDRTNFLGKSSEVLGNHELLCNCSDLKIIHQQNLRLGDCETRFLAERHSARAGGFSTSNGCQSSGLSKLDSFKSCATISSIAFFTRVKASKRTRTAKVASRGLFILRATAERSFDACARRSECMEFSFCNRDGLKVLVNITQQLMDAFGGEISVYRRLSASSSLPALLSMYVDRIGLMRIDATRSEQTRMDTDRRQQTPPSTERRGTCG